MKPSTSSFSTFTPSSSASSFTAFSPSFSISSFSAFSPSDSTSSFTSFSPNSFTSRSAASSPNSFTSRSAISLPSFSISSFRIALVADLRPPLKMPFTMSRRTPTPTSVRIALTSEMPAITQSTQVMGSPMIHFRMTCLKMSRMSP